MQANLYYKVTSETFRVKSPLTFSAKIISALDFMGARRSNKSLTTNFVNPLYTGDSYTFICWMSPFVSLGVSGLFCNFYSVLDGKFC